MPATQHSTGTQATTPGTDHDLATLTGPAGGAHYVLVLDASTLANGELLLAYAKREIAAGGTVVEWWRLPVARDAQSGGAPLIDTQLALRLPEGVDGVLGIRQVGGSSRSILWAVERIDG